jgi:hypothetical protein
MLERREGGMSKMCSAVAAFVFGPWTSSLCVFVRVVGRSPRTAFGVRYRTSSVLRLAVLQLR